MTDDHNKILWTEIKKIDLDFHEDSIALLTDCRESLMLFFDSGSIHPLKNVKVN